MKSWSRSRTVWFNALMLLTLLLDAILTNAGIVRELIPAELYPTIVGGLTIANVWLRSITSGPIKWGGGEQPDDRLE